jgi:hypothetical protein
MPAFCMDSSVEDQGQSRREALASSPGKRRTVYLKASETSSNEGHTGNHQILLRRRARGHVSNTKDWLPVVTVLHKCPQIDLRRTPGSVLYGHRVLVISRFRNLLGGPRVAKWCRRVGSACVGSIGRGNFGNFYSLHTSKNAK